MYKLAKLLFPNNPRMVRYRKLQMLFIMIFLCVLACVLVGLVLFGMNYYGK